MDRLAGCKLFVYFLASYSGNDHHIRICDYRLGVSIENEMAILVRSGHRAATLIGTFRE